MSEISDAAMAMVAKPLMLKDLLELDCDSCSAAGFRCYPRHLCVDVPLPVARHEVAAEAHGVFGRSRSLRPRPSMLSIRSLSRRLRGSFGWGRRDEEEAAPVPAASMSCSSHCSEASESSSSTERKSSESSDFSSSACSAESLHAGVTATTAADGQEHEAMKRGSTGTGSGSESDDKEQLSPVAVMDFPFHDDVEDDEAIDDGGSACSPSFSDSLAQLRQRRNIQLKQRIRRFRSIGEVVAAVDLGERFAGASESDDGLTTVPVQQCHADTDVARAPSCLEGHRSVDERQYPDEHNSDIGLQTRTFWAALDASERLLLDFFAETRGFSTAGNCDQAAVKLAEDWIRGTGDRWGLKEVLCGRKDLVAEIDRGQQWSSHVGEEQEIGVLVAGLVVGELVRELVNDVLL